MFANQNFGRTSAKCSNLSSLQCAELLRFAPNRFDKSTLELCQECAAKIPHAPRGIGAFPHRVHSNNRVCRSGFQDPGNETSSHPALSVFLTTRKRMPVHARATHTYFYIAEKAPMEVAAAERRAFSRLVGFAGGHAKPAEVDASGRLLLPLLTREEPGKLREDVRAAKIRVTLVGNVLREVAKPLQRR
jgi:hypothetical protein